MKWLIESEKSLVGEKHCAPTVEAPLLNSGSNRCTDSRASPERARSADECDGAYLGSYLCNDVVATVPFVAQLPCHAFDDFGSKGTCSSNAGKKIRC